MPPARRRVLHLPQREALRHQLKEFALRLLKDARVAAVPGTAFGECGEGYLRCCYATAFSLLEEACDKMARFCDSLKG